VAAPLTAPTRFKRVSSHLDAFLFFYSSTYWIPGHPHLVCLPTLIKMAAVPFGFSFGDFVAAIEVIHKVTRALRRSSGARCHFHQTVADLESFETVLRRVEALSPTTSSPDTLEAIRLCAFKCHLPLNRFLQRIRLYEKHMDRSSGSKTQLVQSVTGGFWKAKWAIKVEEEVAKLKADIGPLLEAISVLLQIESREQGAATHDAVKTLVDDVTSGFDRMMLAVQEQALATRRIDLRTTDMQLDTQTVVQQLPQLPTSIQLDELLSTTGGISAKVDLTATKDQIDRLASPMPASLVTHMTTTAVTKRQSVRILHMGCATQDFQNVIQIPDRSHFDPTTTPTFDSPAPMPPTSRKPRSMQSHRSDQSKPADSQVYCRSQSQMLLSSICRLLVSAVMALVLLFPNMQSQLRTFMTLLKTPQLLSSNSITIIDALGRTKLLPYEYFCNWNLVQPWLEHVFKGSPGESRVHQGHFALFEYKNNKPGQEIYKRAWERSVFPGDEFVMSMRTVKLKDTKCQICGGQIKSFQPRRSAVVEW
jgi:hypothetical protein